MSDRLILLNNTIRYFTHFQASPGFYVSQHKSFEDTVGKGEVARNEQLLLFPQCFPPYLRTFRRINQF